jgi:hypothetical protein
MCPQLKRASVLLLLAALGCGVLDFVATDSAEAQSRLRPRTRVRVMPAYPYRTFSTTYPVPYEYEYPGPGHVRQCAARLVPEHRPSGPVIVPRMHCWWEPG